MTYDPADRHDPLRHRYSDRKVHSAFEIPWQWKVANGLGVPAEGITVPTAASVRHRNFRGSTALESFSIRND